MLNGGERNSKFLNSYILFFYFMLEKFQKNGKYLMLALDHRGSFKKYVRKENPEAVSDAEIVSAKKLIIDALYDDMSGVLIDPDWGLPAYQEKEKPFLLCIEKTGYSESAGERTTELQYSAEELADLGASGVKLLLYFNPAASNVNEQLATAKDVADQCDEVGLPLFLEIVTYGEEAKIDKGSVIVRSIEMLLDNDIVPAVFKLEYPESPEACAAVSDMLALRKIPWILLTGGEDYDTFKERLIVAVKHGAVGFLAGRAIWQEMAGFTDEASRIKFINEVARNRFKDICEIAGN